MAQHSNEASQDHTKARADFSDLLLAKCHCCGGRDSFHWQQRAKDALSIPKLSFSRSFKKNESTQEPEGTCFKDLKNMILPLNPWRNPGESRESTTVEVQLTLQMAGVSSCAQFTVYNKLHAQRKWTPSLVSSLSELASSMFKELVSNIFKKTDYFMLFPTCSRNWFHKHVQ
jgi:hypothetical protein